MKLAILLLFSGCAFGQVDPALLPSWVVGAGYDWTRGSQYHSALDFTIAKQISGGRWYLWNTLSTPITFHSHPDPVPTAIKSGGAWVAAQTLNGRGAFTLLAQGTLSQIQTQAGSSLEPGVAGTFALTYRVVNNWYLMIFAETAGGLSSTTTTTSASAATVTTVTNPQTGFVFQLGAQIDFGFPPVTLKPAAQPSAKMMRKVMQRLHIPVR